MDSSTIMIIGWNGDINHVNNLKATLIKSFVIPYKEPDWNYITLNGTTTDITENYNNICEDFINHVFDVFKFEIITDTYYTASIIVNNKVYFIDLLNNFADYSSHPYQAIGKMYILRERLDNLLPNLIYPPQNTEWIKEESDKFTNNLNKIISTEVQLKLLELIRNKI